MTYLGWNYCNFPLRIINSLPFFVFNDRACLMPRDPQPVVTRIKAGNAALLVATPPFLFYSLEICLSFSKFYLLDIHLLVLFPFIPRLPFDGRHSVLRSDPSWPVKVQWLGAVTHLGVESRWDISLKLLVSWSATKNDRFIRRDTTLQWQDLCCHPRSASCWSSSVGFLYSWTSTSPGFFR